MTYKISRDILTELDVIVSLFKICKNPKNDADFEEAIKKVDVYLKSIKDQVNKDDAERKNQNNISRLPFGA